MSDEPQVISPRGIPPIRPDWLVDVAWRLGAWGLDRLRTFSPGDPWSLTDEVDGEPWRFDAHRFSPHWTTTVEFESDLYLPTDGPTPTLRAAFAFTPWWDADRGAALQARVEIGPRGPVTFDPENWGVVLPLPIQIDALPTIAGVARGAWEPADRAGDPAPQPATLDDLTGKAVSLRDLSKLLDEERSIPELLVSAYALTTKRGLLRRERVEPAALPGALLTIAADGPLRATWSGSVDGDDLDETSATPLERLDVEPEHVVLRTALGTATIAGPGITATVTAPYSPA